MTEKTLENILLDVLIVEDDRLLNQVMCLQVKESGCLRVRSAQRGQHALKLIGEGVPSVLILDLGLPDMNGRQLIAELRRNALTHSMPLIIHSSCELSAEEKTELQLGPTMFITKSTAFSERLGELIREVTKPGD
jgi:two-component system KDP operon response regulator KdpE